MSLWKSWRFLDNYITKKLDLIKKTPPKSKCEGIFNNKVLIKKIVWNQMTSQN
jgi:hypothetical protein